MTEGFISGQGYDDPRLDRFRVPADGRCWWCGERKPLTREHKHKLTELKRMATEPDGEVKPGSLYRHGHGYSGSLRTLAKGAAVKWGAVMCHECNGSRDLPFDQAYEGFSLYLREHQEHFARKRVRWNWADVYPDDPLGGAVNLARYWGKQLGCMLATHQMPIPTALPAFLDGSPRCDEVAFQISRHRSWIDLYHLGRRDGVDPFGTRMPPCPAFEDDDGNFVGVDYHYGLGYFQIHAFWRTNEPAGRSFFEMDRWLVPLLGNRLPWRVRHQRSLTA